MVPSRANGTSGNRCSASLRTVQQHAERAAHAAEHLHHLVEDIVVLWRHIGLGGDRGNARHVHLPQFMVA